MCRLGIETEEDSDSPDGEMMVLPTDAEVKRAYLVAMECLASLVCEMQEIAEGNKRM